MIGNPLGYSYPMDAGISVLPCNWLNQAHKTGTVKALQDAAALAALPDTKAQWQIFAFRTPQFWYYMGSNTGWRHSLKREKILNTDDKKGKKGNNGETECIGQNERTVICITNCQPTSLYKILQYKRHGQFRNWAGRSVVGQKIE